MNRIENFLYTILPLQKDNNNWERAKYLLNNRREKSYLKIGKIPYANLFPIFYMLQKECNCSGYEFIEGVPSTVNRLLRSGEIDVSPSSSIEYLRYENQYSLIENHSISSKGPAGSILLMSRKPIEELEGETILVSSQSETSVVLLEIILKKFYGVEYSMESTDESPDSLISKAGVFLVIGDEALKAKKTISNSKFQIPNKGQNTSLLTHYSSGDTPFLNLPPRVGGQGWGETAATPSRKSEIIHIYDLGDLWYKNTALPFVFALWIARKDCLTQKNELIKTFIHDLEKAKALALRNLNEIAGELMPLLHNRYSLNMTREELVSYWTGISYDLSEEHKRGLELFRKYAEELHPL